MKADDVKSVNIFFEFQISKLERLEVGMSTFLIFTLLEQSGVLNQSLLSKYIEATEKVNFLIDSHVYFICVSSKLHTVWESYNVKGKFIYKELARLNISHKSRICDFEPRVSRRNDLMGTTIVGASKV